MTAPTPESKLAALVLRIREAVLLAQAAREQEARMLADGAGKAREEKRQP